MTTTIIAVYEQGVLRPLQPLHLREHQQVRLQVIVEEPVDPVTAALTRLAQAGVLTPPRGQSEIAPLSEPERRALAEQLGQAPGKPTSEIIIEDRGAW